MKIGIDCRLVNKIQNTGISRYSEFLLDYYEGRFGSENIILISNDFNFKLKDFPVRYTKLKPYNIFHFFQFEKFVNSLDINLLHIPFYSGFFKKNEKIKVILTVHDLMYRFVDNFFSTNKLLNRLKINYFDIIIKYSLANADSIISVSETTKRDLYNIFGVESIHIPEYSTIDVEDDERILNKYNLRKKFFYFYCGNNRSHKNISFIKEIFKNNLQIPPLVLVGKHHNGCKNVLSIGIVSEEELKALYKYSIAFVFPSKYEGFGLPILESLSEGTFVIASKIDAFLEFKSKNIFFFELGNNEEFLSAIEKSRTSNFISEDFLNHYDKKRIYQLNDKVVNNLLDNVTYFEI